MDLRHAALEPLGPFFSDWIGVCQELQPLIEEFHKDLFKRANTRGFSIIMIDMPAVGKAFDRSLETGMFPFEESIPKTLGGPKGPLASLIAAVLSCGDERVGALVPNLDPDVVFFMRTMFYFYKKFEKDCDDETIRLALRSFVETDSRIQPPGLCWTADWLDIPDTFREASHGRLVGAEGRTPSALREVVWRVARLVSTAFPEVDSLSLVPKHGPGAVAEGSKHRDKYLFEDWPQKLDWVFPSDAFASSNLQPCGRNREVPARVLAVPKTLKGPRIITAEPLSYQYCQQAMLTWIRQHVPGFLIPAIDFSSQAKSWPYVLQGSLDNSFATIDLSEASDRLSLLAVEILLGGNESLLRALHSCRSRWCEVTGQGYFILKKYAGMGNATTFPVQTLCYAILAVACVVWENGWKVTKKNILRATSLVQVYGDDIVVPSAVVDILGDLLSDFGLKVNHEKTFLRGPFRESCGLDAYRGCDVTPFYFRTGSPQDRSGYASWVEVTNNAYKKGLWKLSDWMWHQIPKRDRNCIPVSSRERFSLRLHSFQRVDRIQSRHRINKRLQRTEFLIFEEATRQRRVERDSLQSLLQYFVEAPSAETKWSSGWVKSSQVRLRLRWVSMY
jgi:thiol-disulfide isomerase/thioredoxin